MGQANAKSPKTRRERRREERDAKLAAEEVARLRYARRKWTVLGLVPLTAAVAAVTYFGLEDTQLTGVTILVGGIAFLILGLSLLGSAVRPRDRIRSGSIDFGQKR